MNDDSSWREVADCLATEVAALPPGGRLPTHRTLVARFGVSATTVSRALAELGRRGLVVARPGAGTFRSDVAPAPRAIDTTWQEAALALTPGVGEARSRTFDASGLLRTLVTPGPEVTDLAGGYLHADLRPQQALMAAAARAARRPEAWDRPPATGLPELRDRFARDITPGLTRHDILVCGGGQSALSLALRALTRPGDPVAVESPTYPGTLAAAGAAEVRPVPVPLDAEGLRVSYLDEALARTGARLVVTQPLWQNPTGATLSAGRRRELLAVAAAHDAFVVEDDVARLLAHADAGPVPAPLVADDTRGAVVHIRSLTKAASPGLRVAALAARGPAMSRLRAAHVVECLFVPASLQLTALELLGAPGWARTHAAVGRALQARREAATGAIVGTLGPQALPVVPRGGFHLWVRLPGHLDAGEIAAAAASRGVALTPGDAYAPGAAAEPHLRVSYVAAPSGQEVADALRRLGEVVVSAG